MSKTVVYLSSVLPLFDKEKFDSLYSLLSKTRKEKTDRCKLKEDKILSLGAGILLKKACVDFNIENFDNDIIYNEKGKPFFKNSQIKFNISHSDNLVALAISEKDVGIDVEFIKPVNQKLFDKVFSLKEKQDFLLSEKENFFKLWTLKESYIKLLGKGLSMGLKSFQIDKKTLKVLGDEKTNFYSVKRGEYYISCAYLTDEIEILTVDF